MEEATWERLGRIGDVLHFFKLYGYVNLLSKICVLLRILKIQYMDDLDAFITAEEGKRGETVKESWNTCDQATDLGECWHPTKRGDVKKPKMECHQQNCPWTERQMDDAWWAGHPGRMPNRGN